MIVDLVGSNSLMISTTIGIGIGIHLFLGDRLIASWCQKFVSAFCGEKSATFSVNEVQTKIESNEQQDE